MTRTRKRTDISLWDHIKLKHELASRPRYVLRYFKQCDVGCLTELSCFLEILTEAPNTATRIALVAASMGIRTAMSHPPRQAHRRPVRIPFLKKGIPRESRSCQFL
ncbi:MAG: hypothetical protein JWN14_792 [Chthonomonadales bacterium]|nr:hypothetical protein [Chthonomonadales bacterium]